MSAARITPVRWRASASAILLLLCAVVVTSGALFYIWQRYQFTRLGFEVAALRQQKAELLQHIEPLQVEVQYLSRLERVDALARQQLGMRAPAPAHVIVLENPDATQAP